MYKIILLITLLIFSQSSYSIVKRHDISPEQYNVKVPPGYLIDMPHEGHGVLIAPNWIVTVSHVIFYDYTGKSITIGNKVYKIPSLNFFEPIPQISNTSLEKSLIVKLSLCGISFKIRIPISTGDLLRIKELIFCLDMSDK